MKSLLKFIYINIYLAFSLPCFLYSSMADANGLVSIHLNSNFGNQIILINDSCDNIILRNGDEISCKVIEVGVTEIKYNKCLKASGPVYIILKSDIFMIQYSNGSKDIIAKGSESEKREESSSKIYSLDEVDEKPEFSGGLDYLPTYISLNLNYNIAKKYELIGSTVNVSFVVDEFANLVEPKIIKSVHPALDEEALRVIRKLKFKNSAYKDFKPVNVEIQLGITFKQ